MNVLQSQLVLMSLVLSQRFISVLAFD